MIIERNGGQIKIIECPVLNADTAVHDLRNSVHTLGLVFGSIKRKLKPFDDELFKIADDVLGEMLEQLNRLMPPSNSKLSERKKIMPENKRKEGYEKNTSGGRSSN
jgi:hypothetical protein